MSASLPPSYFDALYDSDPDPWQFETSLYERAKYDATLAGLPSPHYARALEIGCSIGVLTERLALRCGALVAVDPATKALEAARRRCRQLGHIAFVEAGVPDFWPAGRFDLILLSEVVYYLSVEDVRRLARQVADSIDTGGHIALVHWIGATDYPLSGDEASALFLSALGDRVEPVRQERAEAYRLDVLRAR
ncbi:MAG TPA: SAM-dependent methyltransferase [Xanthobacteraceae bacterium]|nr:SAM-dependent methyltransferase [Xanthobacteraceae bacterium]